MAAKAKKTVARKATRPKAAAAAEPKDGKATFGKAAPKRVKAGEAAKPSRAAKAATKPSIAKRVIGKVKDTAAGAVQLAAAAVGRRVKAK